MPRNISAHFRICDRSVFGPCKWLGNDGSHNVISFVNEQSGERKKVKLVPKYFYRRYTKRSFSFLLNFFICVTNYSDLVRS